MNTVIDFKTVTRSTLIATAMTVGLITGYIAVAESTEPQAHSDGLRAALNDTEITAKVKSKLAAEDSLKTSDISVTTVNGIVTLKGMANTSDTKALAEKDALMVQGVRSVDNTLTTPSSNRAVAETKQVAAKTERVMSDSWITTKVKSELLADSVSKGVDVSVKTHHGVVVLKGKVSSREAIDHVKNIAKKVDGVKSVNTSGLLIASN
jgi:hyperosmotically inducible protein